MKINKTVVFENFDDIKNILENNKVYIFGSDNITLDFSLIYSEEKNKNFMHGFDYISLLPENLRRSLPTSQNNFLKYLEVNNIIVSILNKYYKSREIIPAIKELRAQTTLYLKESKDIIDYLFANVKPNM